jgi:hypothetical protein
VVRDVPTALSAGLEGGLSARRESVVAAGPPGHFQAQQLVAGATPALLRRLHPDMVSESAAFYHSGALGLEAALGRLSTAIEGVSDADGLELGTQARRIARELNLPTLPPLARAVAHAAVAAWSAQFQVSVVGFEFNHINEAHPSTLGGARAQAVQRLSEGIATAPLAPRAAAVPSPTYVSTTARSASKDASKSLAALSHVFEQRPHAMDAPAMVAASPFSMDSAHPHSRVDYEAARLYSKQFVEGLTNVEAAAQVPTRAPQPLQGSIPSRWQELEARYLQDKGKPAASPLRSEAPAFNSAAIRTAHLDANRYSQCITCTEGTCPTGSLPVMSIYAGGSPLPFAPHGRARLYDVRPPPTYHMEPHFIPFATAAILDLVATGKARIVPGNSALLCAPLFIVDSLRFAPLPAELAAFEAQSVEQKRAAFKKLAVSVMSDAWSRCSLRDAQDRALPASVVAAALSQIVTDRKLRLVMDSKASGLNGALASWHFSYCSIAEILHNARPGMWMASIDIKAAFHLVPLHPSDTRYAGFRFPRDPMRQRRQGEGIDMVEMEMLRLWFGLKTAPAHFSTISGEIAATLQRRARRYSREGDLYFFVFMDDLFILSLTKALGDRAYEDAFAYLKEIGAEANEKAVRPAQRLQVLGLMVDFTNPRGVELSLPADKAYSCNTLVALLIEAADNSVRMPFYLIEKVIGKLGHASEVVLGGQRHLITTRDALRGVQDGEQDGVDLAGCLQDLEWWQQQLCEKASTRLRLTRTLASTVEMVNVKSDASGDVGAAIIVGNAVAFWYRWNQETALPSRSIQAKEIFPLVLLLEEYGSLFRGLTVAYATDNAANAYALNSGSIRDKEARPLLFRALEAADKYGFRIRAAWNPRENNDLMDRMSKAPTRAEAFRALPLGFVNV